MMKSIAGLVLFVALIGLVRCNDPGESIPGVLDLSTLMGYLVCIYTYSSGDYHLVYPQRLTISRLC